MSILLDNNSVVVIQGITGKQGTSACTEMLAYGTRVVAGVTPGKGGQTVDGVGVHDTVAEAMRAYPDMNVSLICVPPPFVKDAALEAMAAGLKLIVILSEGVPALDTAEMLAHARLRGVTIIGPSSVGVISVGKAKVGPIGGPTPDEIFVAATRRPKNQKLKTAGHAGTIGVISKSGGMTLELGLILKNAGYSVTTALSIGGDMIVCSDFADLLRLFEKDRATDAVVIYGELGGSYEEQAAVLIKQGGFTKPFVAFIAGTFAETYLPKGQQLGHAGAIIEGGRGTVESKVEALRDAGATVVDAPYDIHKALKRLLGVKKKERA